MRKLTPFAMLSLAGFVAAPAALASGGFGMTWTKISHEATYSTDKVGCPSCNPYTGDTSCNLSLPVLCIRQDSSPNPGLVIDFYNGWAGGNIHLTPPIPGTSLGGLPIANNLCVSYFGPGYRMAEFHDGLGGWNWSAYGNISGASAFWVYINDQPANCWNP